MATPFPFLSRTSEGVVMIQDGAVVDERLTAGISDETARRWADVLRQQIEDSLDAHDQQGETEWMVCSPASRPDEFTVELSSHDFAYAVGRLMLADAGWTLHGCRP